MSFAIINSKTVIELVNSSDEFCDFISKRNPQAKILDFKNINDIKNDTIDSGEYIIENENVIILIKKTITKNKGWFKTNKTVDIQILDTWTLFDSTINTYNINNTNNTNNTKNANFNDLIINLNNNPIFDS